MQELRELTDAHHVALKNASDFGRVLGLRVHNRDDPYKHTRRPRRRRHLHSKMSDSATLASVLESQNTLLQEASLALPHQFSQCTYSLGPIRQAVYLCLTCTPPPSSSSSAAPSVHPRGICAACSVACHTEHEQLELFPKRAFRCDCPTRALAHPCTLHTHRLEEPNGANEYGRNFRATFCRCGRAYDAQTERETMIQCVACEVRPG